MYGFLRHRFGQIIYDRIPKPMPEMAGHSGADAISGILVLINGENPTFSYYLEERLRHIQTVNVVVRKLTDTLDDVKPDGLFVILCRYVKLQQIAWLRRVRPCLAGVALVIDDDLAAIITGPDGSLRYKANVLRLGVLPLHKLNPLLSEVWASTAELGKVLVNDRADVQILSPLPPALHLRKRAGIADDMTPLRIVFHATGIHRREHEFLYPIIRQVLIADPRIHFEVLADGSIAGGWHRAGLPADRYTVRKTMKWRDYAAWAGQTDADIALVPLLQSRTNNVRADTKRIDVARLGAAAIYSKCEIFDRCAVEGEVHVGNNADEWIAGILRLTGDSIALNEAKKAAFVSLEKMVRLSDTSFPFSPRLLSGA